MNKYCFIFLCSILLCLQSLDKCQAENQSKIFCFIENTALLNDSEDTKNCSVKSVGYEYSKTMLQSLIPHLWAFARSHKYEIEFCPIGMYTDPHAASVSSMKNIQDIFTFDHKFVYIHNSLIRNPRIQPSQLPDKKTIVIVISQFIPRHISEANQFISCKDYQDIQDATHTIQKWQKNNISLHFIQLVNNATQCISDYPEPFDETIKNNIQSLKHNRKKYISKKQKHKLINDWVHRLTSSDHSNENMSIVHRYQVKKGHFLDTLWITDAIIDPTKIQTFYVSLIVDKNLYGGSKKHISQFIAKLKTQLKRQGPKVLCNNPLRKVEFRVRKSDDHVRYRNSNKKDHYQYHIKQGVLKQYAQLIVKNQDIQRIKKNQKEYITRPGHSRYQIFYQSYSDLISQVLFALQKLRSYQEIDFKILEQYRKLRVDCPNTNLFKGYKICKKKKTCKRIQRNSLLSNQIVHNGEFELRVNMQGKTELCLVEQADDDNDQNYMTGLDIGWITEDMLLQESVDTPVNITGVRLPLSRVTFQDHPDMCKNTQNNPVLFVKLNDPTMDHQPIAPQAVCQIQFSKEILPGKYFYHVIYPYPDYSGQYCLNRFYQNFRISFIPENVVSLTCTRDRLSHGKNPCAFFHKWKLFDEQTKFDHIAGSPNFFKCLLTCTSKEFDRSKKITSPLKNIWTEAYETLIEKNILQKGTYKTEAHIVLDEAFKKMGDLNDVDFAEDHFMRIMDKICNYQHARFNSDQKRNGYIEVLRRIQTILDEGSNDSKEFIRFLKAYSL